MSSLWAWMTSLDATIIDAGAEAYARGRESPAATSAVSMSWRVAALVDWAERYLLAPRRPHAHMAGQSPSTSPAT